MTVADVNDDGRGGVRASLKYLLVPTGDQDDVMLSLLLATEDILQMVLSEMIPSIMMKKEVKPEEFRAATGGQSA